MPVVVRRGAPPVTEPAGGRTYPPHESEPDPKG